ncbi:TetR/AcrR family transcriptional regulator [Clostridium saccharobutylicum]|uniref:TetR/AcrR family transcriptional regulator n=1 Tax=Clostridium saccharobutylicum TaxID=169679 RepID=UPI0017A0CFF3|nr:TetR family transcriptional regulator [Clostridium saccharobutylicum]MBA8980821.1 AcrR family transcriptional regulator [Clostridium saccharobutylicum]
MGNKIDLRVLKTRENIKNTFSNLLLEKDFKNITVQDICDRALIGRSTFYDHYCDKYDLLNKMVEEIINQFKPYLKSRFNLNSFR